MGYATDKRIRANAASGGMVTALLCSLLKNKQIDGALVAKAVFSDAGEPCYKVFIATTPGQVRSASSSVYMAIPMMSYVGQLGQFCGKLAVVLTPCMMHAFSRILEKDEGLRKKIVLKIGLFCSGVQDIQATGFVLDKCHIPRDGATRLYYRRGHWRGKSGVMYQDGGCRDFSYAKSFCAYKNAYFFIKKSCLSCKDQFAQEADISFGDIWIPKMKKKPVKYTGCAVRSQKAYRMLLQAERQGDIVMAHMTDDEMLKSQARALAFKYREGKLNRRLAGFLAEKDRQFSISHPRLLKLIPRTAIYYYMCAIRLLLSR